MIRWLAALILLAAPAQAQSQRPLFELGIGGGGAFLPDYPAAEQSRLRGIVAPWLIYRGDILRADEQGARARTWLGDRVELAISGSGSFPASSRDNRAREGMPDLDWIGEIGPTVIWTIWRDLSPASPRRLVLDTPVRAAFSTDLTSVRYRGLIFEPDIAWQQRNLLFEGSRLRLSLGLVFGDQRYMEYFYGVAPELARVGRPSYDARAGYLGTRISL
ncbi:MAG TPA: MipA/OmpV family protein, partial [Acetobacteraceae bacterium]|nr:MipA/OmpV family protein [Acetobacteraceae bacterium]